MKHGLFPLVLAALLLAPSFSQATMAQQRVTASQLAGLEQQTLEQYGAYQRFAMAEQEALEDGSKEFAQRYHEAKVKAYEAYAALDAQLQTARAQKGQQDARARVPDSDSR